MREHLPFLRKRITNATLTEKASSQAADSTFDESLLFRERVAALRSRGECRASFSNRDDTARSEARQRALLATLFPALKKSSISRAASAAAL